MNRRRAGGKRISHNSRKKVLSKRVMDLRLQRKTVHLPYLAAGIKTPWLWRNSLFCITKQQGVGVCMGCDLNG